MLGTAAVRPEAEPVAGAAVEGKVLRFMRLVDADTRERLRKVRLLYEKAFPRSEKKPFGMILRGRKKGNYEVLAVEGEDGGFQGLAVTMRWGELVLLDYFAVEPQCRGTGVGSRALSALQERYRGKKFLLEIESTVGVEDREDARNRRKAFYLRNGMESMDFLVNLFGVEMELMTCGCTVTFEEYHTIFEHLLPFGMAARIKPAGSRLRGNADKNVSSDYFCGPF